MNDRTQGKNLFPIEESFFCYLNRILHTKTKSRLFINFNYHFFSFQ